MYTSRNHICIFKYRIIEIHIDVQHRICAVNNQSLCIPVPIKGRRESCKKWFLLRNLIRYIRRKDGMLTFYGRYRDRTLSVISDSVSGIFKRERVIKGTALSVILRRYIRRFSNTKKITHILRADAFAIIYVTDVRSLVCKSDHITGMLCHKVKQV